MHSAVVNCIVIAGTYVPVAISGNIDVEVSDIGTETHRVFRQGNAEGLVAAAICIAGTGQTQLLLCLCPDLWSQAYHSLL